MKKAEGWFKKNLTMEQADIYFSHLDYIPDVAINDIVNGIIRNTKPMPGNFPTINDIKTGWWKWQQDNPSLVKKREKVPCEECGGRGWLWFKTENPQTKLVSEYTVGCEFCNNWKVEMGTGHRIPLSSKAKLEVRGYEVWPYEYKPKMKYKSIEDMAAGIGERIE
jgi:hypothetical protein